MFSIMDVMEHVVNNFKEENIRRMEKHSFDYFSLLISKKVLDTESADSIQGNYIILYNQV
jgi:hypothetical protein